MKYWVVEKIMMHFYIERHRKICHDFPNDPILTELDSCLIIITVTSPSEHGLRIQRHEAYFRALTNAVIKREIPLWEGTVYLYKADLRGKFLWHQPMMPWPSPRQTAAREIKGQAALQRRLSFTPCP